MNEADHEQEQLPSPLSLRLEKISALRYGENPHQAAALYRNPGDVRPGVASARMVQGKELSFNNLQDADAAFECVAEFEEPAAVIVKHMNPCGVSYDGAAFTPAEVTVKKGSTVTFTSTGPDMWVATAMHPDHKGYAGTTLKEHCPDTTDTAFDQCAVGATYTTKFEKVGTWPYHNHVKGGVYGKVIVVE